MNNNAGFNKLFTAEYAKSSKASCKRCKNLIAKTELRIGSNQRSTHHDGFIFIWYHFECIFLSGSAPSHWRDISGLYLIRYEDQMKIITKIGLPFDATSSLESAIKEENEEFYYFIGKLNGVRDKDLQDLLHTNHYARQKGRPLKMNRVAEFLTFGPTEKCPGCGFGNLIYEMDVHQCRNKKNDGHKCMFQTSTPNRRDCIIPNSKSWVIFESYVPRVKDRTLRLIETEDIVDGDDTDRGQFLALDHSSQSSSSRFTDSQGVDGSSEPVRKKRKVFFKNSANDSEEQYSDGRHVFIDNNGCTYACTLYKVNLALNHNSYYKMKVLQSDDGNEVWLLSEYGRTGHTEPFTLKTMDSVAAACALFEKKFVEKCGNTWGCTPYSNRSGKYVVLQIDYREKKAFDVIESHIQSNGLDASVQNLMKIIFSEEIMSTTLLEHEIDLGLLPHGMMSEENLDNAMLVLDTIFSDHLNGVDENNGSYMTNSVKFYQLIPQSNGPNPLPIISNLEQFSKKFNLIQELRQMEVAYNVSSSSADVILESYQGLGSKISRVAEDSDERAMIAEYAKNTFSSKHFKYLFQIEDVFKVESDVDNERFKPHDDCSNRMLLWHGSRVANIASIVKNGLKILPPAGVPITGKMFGNGIYFADMVSKAAMFICPQEEEQKALLLVCEVALGDMHVVVEPLSQNFCKEDLPAGKKSVKVNGKTFPEGIEIFENGIKVPMGYQHDTEGLTGLNFNEYVIFDESQYKIRFLVQVRFTNENFNS